VRLEPLGTEILTSFL